MKFLVQQTIRILLVDDHALFRESVARLLQAEPDLEVVGEAGTIEGACGILRDGRVDMVLLDFDLGQRDGLEFMVSAPAAGFVGKILLVTAGVSELNASRLIRSGIAGIFVKHSSPALLIHAIHEVMAGKVWFDQDYLSRVVTKTAQESAAPRTGHFTSRERQVLALVFEGLANKQIADRLQISESAVKSALQQLFGKTGVRTRSQLVRIVLERYKDQL